MLVDLEVFEVDFLREMLRCERDIQARICQNPGRYVAGVFDSEEIVLAIHGERLDLANALLDKIKVTK